MLDYAILALASLILAVALYTLHKVRRMHIMLYSASTVPEMFTSSTTASNAGEVWSISSHTSVPGVPVNAVPIVESAARNAEPGSTP